MAMAKLIQAKLFRAKLGLLLGLVILVALASCPLNVAAQDKDGADKAYKTAADQTGSAAELKKTIEPGVFVIGKAHRFAEAGDCDSFSLSPDGKTLACSGGQIKLFDLEENKIRETVGEEGEHYRGVEFSDDGRFLVAHTYKNGGALIRIWDAIDLSLINSFAANEGMDSAEASTNFYIQKFKVSPENNYIAACDYQSLVVRDFKTGELVHEISNLGWVQSVAFSPDDRQLLVPKSGSVQAIDLESGESLGSSDSNLAGAIATVLDVNKAQKIVAIANGNSIRIAGFGNSNRDRVLTLPAGSYANG